MNKFITIFRLTAKTDVFGIGIVLLLLTSFSNDCAPTNFHSDGTVPLSGHFDSYLEDLQIFVRHCTAESAKERPSLAYMQQNLDTYTQSGTSSDRASGLMELPGAQVAAHRGGDLDLSVESDRHAITAPWAT